MIFKNSIVSLMARFQVIFWPDIASWEHGRIFMRKSVQNVLVSLLPVSSLYNKKQAYYHHQRIPRLLNDFYDNLILSSFDSLRWIPVNSHKRAELSAAGNIPWKWESWSGITCPKKIRVKFYHQSWGLNDRFRCQCCHEMATKYLRAFFYRTKNVVLYMILGIKNFKGLC